MPVNHSADGSIVVALHNETLELSEEIDVLLYAM
jgi:hypothetical protein